MVGVSVGQVLGGGSAPTAEPGQTLVCGHGAVDPAWWWWVGALGQPPMYQRLQRVLNIEPLGILGRGVVVV